MKKFKGTMKSGFKVALVYRFDFFVNLLIAPISLVVFYFLWKSIYSYSGEDVIKGFTFTAMVSYYLLNMIVGFFTWSRVERWIEHEIRFGHMIMNLLRPLEYISSCFLFELGLNLLGVVLQAIPLFIIGIIFFGVDVAPLANMIFFAISLLLAHVLFFLISYLIGMVAFWFKRIEGLSRAKKPIVHFLSGGLIPLTFLPLAFQKISYYLPFQYVRYVPISFYLGKYSISEMYALLAVQMVWILLLFGIAKAIWTRAFKKFAGAGA